MFGMKRKLETAFAELATVLPPATDLAADLMPAFGPDGPKHGKDLSSGDLNGWILPQMLQTLPQYEHKLSPQSLKALELSRGWVTGDCGWGWSWPGYQRPYSC